MPVTSPNGSPRMEQYGRSLGMAFQIADDLLDLLGEEDHDRQIAGNRPGEAETDPAAHPLLPTSDSHRTSRNWWRCWNHPTPRRVSNFSRGSNVSTPSSTPVQTACRFADEARRQFDLLPSSPAKDTSLDITDFVVGRSI